jgi:hypothetical protein
VIPVLWASQSDFALSRKLVVQRFGVSEGQVRQIEREGMDNQWPPLEFS